MLKDLYNAIKTRLLNIGTFEPAPNPEDDPVLVPTLKMVDVWNNQYAYADQYKVMKFPHVFVEFAQLPYEQLGNKVQQATAVIRLHVGSRTLDDADLNHFDLIDIITYWMTGFQGTNHGTWTRRSVDVDNDHDSMIAHVITFTTRVIDISAVRQMVRVKGDILEIIKEVVNDI